MKKILLLAVTFGLGLAVSAQSVCKKPPFAIQDGQGNPNKVVTAPPTGNTLKNGNPAPFAVTACDTTGYSGNAYGAYTRGGRSLLFCDPNLGTVIYTHRSSPSRDATANTGHIMFDRSVDGGLTWTTTHQGPVYTPGAELGRYPQGVIYNPLNGSNPALAFTAVYGPCTNGSGWIAHYNAAMPLMGGVAAQQVLTFGANAPNMLIPYNSDLQQNGTWHVCDMGYDGTDYTDTIYIQKGVWNTTSFRYDFSTLRVYWPMSVDAGGVKCFTAAGVAFAATGGTGYLVALGHDQPFSVPFDDSANYLMVRKTTDGGTTWGPITRLCLGTAIDAMMNSTGGGYYTHGFDFDPIVDVNGNLHIAIITSPSVGGFSVPSSSFKIMSDVYTTNGGNSWYIKKIGETQTFRGMFGTTPIGEDNRPQVSANWNRDRLFFSWFDTDTLNFPGQGNLFPDHHVIGANVTNATSIMWSAEQNTTATTCADGVASFGSVPQYVLSNSGIHNIPMAFMVLINADDLAECQYRYGEGIVITDASMTNASGSVLIGCNVGIDDNSNSLFALSNLFPNPTNSTTSFELNLNTASMVNIQITNTLGQTLGVIANEKFYAGVHTVTVDAASLTAGIYFINVNAGGYTITKKLVVGK